MGALPSPHEPIADLGSLAPAGRLGIRSRIAARVRSRALDTALAAGAPTELTPALAVRARQLTALPHRRVLADAYRRLVREAREARVSRARVALCRGRIAAASAELDRLAEVLARPGPVAARGAAQALLLVADGTGPLYNPTNRESLRARAVRATHDLAL